MREVVQTQEGRDGNPVEFQWGETKRLYGETSRALRLNRRNEAGKRDDELAEMAIAGAFD